MPKLLAVVATALLLLSACGGEDTPDGGEAASPPAVVTSPEEEASPAPREPDGFTPASGAAGDGCENGWTRPEREDPLVREALRIIRRHMGVQGGFSLQDFRYFEGPESPPSVKEYILVVKRWYVKGHLKEDPSFRGRWLVEEREFGSGIAAVAPYDTSGLGSPDWVGIEYRERMEPRSFEGLPGEWRGEPFDFVRGSEQPDIRVPGLPEEVRGCLAGT